MKKLILLTIMTFMFVGLQNIQAQEVLIISYIDEEKVQDMKDAFDNLSIGWTYTDSVPDNLENYDGLYVLLGAGITKHLINWSESLKFEIFLDNGGALYIEGRNSWHNVLNVPIYDYFDIDSTTAHTKISIITGTGIFGNCLFYSPNNYNDYFDFMISGETSETSLTTVSNSTRLPVSINKKNETYRIYGSSIEFHNLRTVGNYCTPITYLANITDFLLFTVDITENIQIPAKIISVEYFNMLGQKIKKPRIGFYIERTYTSKGVTNKKFYKIN